MNYFERILNVILGLILFFGLMFSLCLLSGCSKDEEVFSFKSTPYHFVEEFVVWNGVTYELDSQCPISFNDVYLGDGVITITSDCFLTDGYFETEFSNMSFDIDEIVVLGEAIILSHPNTISISVCSESEVRLSYARPSHNEVFTAIYIK